MSQPRVERTRESQAGGVCAQADGVVPGTDAVSAQGVCAPSGRRESVDPEVSRVCCEAFPDEHLLVDDIEGLVPVGSGGATGQTLVEVFTAGDGASVGIARVDLSGGEPAAYLDVIATHPAERRRGYGQQVLDLACEWAAAQGADFLYIGDRLPRGLFSGVDVRWTGAMCLFENNGFERLDVKVDLACPTIGASPVRPGAGMRAVRIVDDDQADTLAEFMSLHAPKHVAAFRTAAQWGTAVLAVDGESGQVYGAAAHSLQRLGVIGPVVCGPGAEERIIIGVLFRTVLGDLSTAGVKSAEIVGAPKMSAYVDAVGARASRVSLVLRRKLP